MAKKKGQITLISWNVNGLRAAIKKDFLESFKRLDADIVALQEIKIQEPQLTGEMKSIEGYESHWSYAVVRLKWFKDIGSTKDICLFNLGVYEAIPTIWGLPQGRITEYKCFFEGDEYCEFKTMPTTEKERDDLFGNDKDWSHVDPVLDEFYKKKYAKS